MSNRNLHLLASPGFLVGLLLLLLNDFVLKGQFHNAFTGKLSDFAGLFVFSLFWAAFFPRQKTFVWIAIAAFFVFWKSAYSQSLIDAWNGLPFFGIQRTVDYSDLSALLILPLSYRFVERASQISIPRPLIYLISIVSIFAFTATQFSQKASFNDQYVFESSKEELLKRISRLPGEEVMDRFWNADRLKIVFDACTREATVTLQEKENQTTITLIELNNRCPSKVEPEKMRQYFEKEFINKLREESVSKSARVLYIWPVSNP